MALLIRPSRLSVRTVSCHCALNTPLQPLISLRLQRVLQKYHLQLYYTQRILVFSQHTLKQMGIRDIHQTTPMCLPIWRNISIRLRQNRNRGKPGEEPPMTWPPAVSYHESSGYLTRYQGDYLQFQSLTAFIHGKLLAELAEQVNQPFNKKSRAPSARCFSPEASHWILSTYHFKHIRPPTN